MYISQYILFFWLGLSFTLIILQNSSVLELPTSASLLPPSNVTDFNLAPWPPVPWYQDVEWFSIPGALRWTVESYGRSANSSLTDSVRRSLLSIGRKSHDPINPGRLSSGIVTLRFHHFTIQVNEKSKLQSVLEVMTECVQEHGPIEISHSVVGQFFGYGSYGPLFEMEMTLSKI